MDLHLTDEQADLLLAALDRIIEGDPYPLSRRVRALRELRALLKPYPERPLPPRLRSHTSRHRVAARLDETENHAQQPVKLGNVG